MVKIILDDKDYPQARHDDDWFLKKFELWLLDKYLPKIPKFIETYHLTMMTVLWCFGILVFSFLAKSNSLWFLGAGLMVFFHFLTDRFDGAVGRYRNTGLVKWGFFMDHFMDYFLALSIFVGFSFFLDDSQIFWFPIFLMIPGGFMVNSFLDFGATQKMKISYGKIGPTETRLLLIIFYVLISVIGGEIIRIAFYPLWIFSVISLAVVVFGTQKRIWKLDMEIKKKRDEKNSN